MATAPPAVRHTTASPVPTGDGQTLPGGEPRCPTTPPAAPSTRPGAGGRLLRLSAAAIVALALVGCGTNQGGGGSTGPGASANQAPAVSPAAELSGELTVWAMGNEGVKLSALADGS